MIELEFPAARCRGVALRVEPLSKAPRLASSGGHPSRGCAGLPMHCLAPPPRERQQIVDQCAHAAPFVLHDPDLAFRLIGQGCSMIFEKRLGESHDATQWRTQVV